MIILLDESVSFAVALKIGEHKYAGGDIIIPYKTQNLQAAVEYFYMMRTQSHRNLCLDRVSKKIKGDYSVSLALRGMNK